MFWAGLGLGQRYDVRDIQYTVYSSLALMRGCGCFQNSEI